MITVPSSTRIFLCVTPVDMRKSFDSLAGLVRDHLGENPLSGHLFVFRNRNEDTIKLLYWDRDGFAIWYKRLQRGTFALPSGTTAGLEIDVAAFAMLLNGIDMRQIQKQKRYTVGTVSG
jgi:transposase